MKLTSDNNSLDYGHKKFNFRIDEKHQMKAIFALINLYKNKIQTPVQEIICNARDAHREVGKPDHTFNIKVSDKQFIVRDFGSGINPEKAQKIFCSIGESTKTDDNTQTGGFGIGAKSPIAYTNQFEVKSYVDGIEYHYIIAKNGDLLEMNLVSEEKTTLENGTKVIIPIKPVKNFYNSTSEKDEFINAVIKTCYFWEKRPNCNFEIDKMDLFLLEGSNRLGFYVNKYFKGTKIVVDGIPYSVDNYKLENGNSVIFYKTGDIRLHETRERLADNDADTTFNFNKIKEDINTLKDYDYKKHITKQNLFTDLKNLQKYGLNVSYIIDGYSLSRYFRKETYMDVYSYEKRSRRAGLKYFKKNVSSIPLGKTELFYNDGNEKDLVVSRKVKHYLENCGEEKYIHVVENKYSKIFNAKKISELEKPSNKRNQVKKENNEITITELKPWQNRIYSKLDNVSKKYLYLGFKSKDPSSTMVYYLRQKGYTVCKLSAESINLVQTHSNFSSYEQTITKFSLNETELNYLYYSKLHQPHLPIRYKDCNDENIIKLNSLIQTYKYAENVNYIPKELFTDKIKEELAKIANINMEIKSLVDYVKKTYALLGNNSEINTEYINAINLYRKNLQNKK